MPKCSDCHETRSKSEFAKSQFKKPPNKWRCRSCARAAALLMEIVLLWDKNMYEESKNSASSSSNSSNNNNNNHSTMNTSNNNSGTQTPTEEATSLSMNPPPLPVSLPTMTNTTITAASATVEGTETASLFETAAAGGGGGGGGGGGEQGQGLHGGSGGNHPNSNNTSRNSTVVVHRTKRQRQPQRRQHRTDPEKNQHTTSSSLSSSPVSSTRSNTTTTNFYTPTAVMSNLVLSTSSSSSSSSPVTALMVPTGIVTEKNKILSGSPSSLQDPQDECVICCYPFPLKEEETTYKGCCGQLICNGCIIAQERTLIIGTNVKKPIAGSKEEELEFLTMLAPEHECVKKPITGSEEEERELRESDDSEELDILCPFCRARPSNNDEERLKRLHTRIKHEDPEAMNMLGGYYEGGKKGLPKNLKKAKELYKRSYDLGNPTAAFNLSLLHDEHIPDEVPTKHYTEEGARRGHVGCMCRLADIAYDSGKYEEATRLYMTAARSGDETAMEAIMGYCYQNRDVSKDDIDTTLRAHKAVIDTGKNEAREYAMRHKAFLKKN